MKYAIVIPDGCADEPQESLGGRTPLQAAHTPHMDALASTGVVGRSNNVPEPLTPAPDDWAVRCNLVTVENEEMRDFTAGHISSEEGRPLIEAMQSACGDTSGPVRIEFHAGVQYRNLL